MKAWEMVAHARHILHFIREWNLMGRQDPSQETTYRLATPQVPWPPRFWLRVKGGQLMRKRELARGFPRAQTGWEEMGTPDHCELVWRDVAEMDLRETTAPDTSPEEWWLNTPMPWEIRCEACGQLGPVTSSGLCHGCKTEGEV